ARDPTHVISKVARNCRASIGDTDRHRRAGRPGVSSYVINADRGLWSGVTTEIVDFVVEGHISTGLRCGQRGARGPGISGDVVDGVFRNMSAGSTDETARDIDLPVPVRTLNILFGGRDVS